MNCGANGVVPEAERPCPWNPRRILEQVGDLERDDYLPYVAPENLVSLTMPSAPNLTRGTSQLHPIFQMNLPEGYLRQVLQEEFGPHIGGEPSGTPRVQLSARNMAWKVPVAPPEAALRTKPVKT